MWGLLQGCTKHPGAGVQCTAIHALFLPAYECTIYSHTWLGTGWAMCFVQQRTAEGPCPEQPQSVPPNMEVSSLLLFHMCYCGADMSQGSGVTVAFLASMSVTTNCIVPSNKTKCICCKFFPGTLIHRVTAQLQVYCAYFLSLR